MIIELKWEQDVETAISQIKEKKYPKGWLFNNAFVVSFHDESSIEAVNELVTSLFGI